MLLRAVLVALALACAPAAPSRAAFVVSIGNATADPGDTVTLDVTITSTNSERLDFFVDEFVLTPADGNSPAGKVTFFVDALTGLPPLPPLLDPSYVFPPGNGFAAANLPSNPAQVTTTAWANDTYNVGDATTDGLGFGVDLTGGRLLAQLTVTVAGSAPGGSAYQVAGGGSSLYLAQAAIDPSDIAVQYEGGLITVNGSTAVATPAPPGAVLAAVGCVCLVGSRAARRQRRASDGTS